MSEKKHIKLRTVFMGSSSFAEKILGDLIKEKYNIVAVYTKPDAKVGRKQEVAENPVKVLAESNGIEVIQPEKFNEEEIERITNLKPDLVIVASYGKIIPRKVIDMPGFGCINVHTSLLPKFRGPSPIQNAILAGEKETGATIMLMDEGIDTGDIISQERMEIMKDDTYDVLFGKLAQLSSDLLIRTVPFWVERKIDPVPQEDSQATLCQLIEREDGKINWTENYIDIYNKYRALFPWPGVYTFWKKNEESVRIKILKMSPIEGIKSEKEEGEVYSENGKIYVMALGGCLELEEVQLEGKKSMKMEEFKNGYPDFIGSILI